MYQSKWIPSTWSMTKVPGTLWCYSVKDTTATSPNMSSSDAPLYLCLLCNWFSPESSLGSKFIAQGMCNSNELMLGPPVQLLVNGRKSVHHSASFTESGPARTPLECPVQQANATCVKTHYFTSAVLCTGCHAYTLQGGQLEAGIQRYSSNFTPPCCGHNSYG